MNAARITTLALTLLISLPAPAARAPGIVDAACEALDLRYRTVESRVSPRERDFFLFEAVGLGCVTLAERLLDAGASVEARDRGGSTPFLIAARMGQDGALELLAERGSNLHQRNLEGRSALLESVIANRRRTTATLLAAGIDPNIPDKRGLTTVIAAAFNGNRRILDALLDAGADASVVDAHGKGALTYATGKGFDHIVERLLAHPDIDVNRVYGRGLTALMWAAGYSNDVPEKDGVATLERLLNAGADVTLVDDRGRTALLIAASRGHEQIVRRLLASGADPTLVDGDAQSIQDLAKDHLGVLQILQEHTGNSKQSGD